MISKKVFGQEGEVFAEEYLKKHKYKILEKNFRIRNGEVDIVAIDYSEKEPILAFVEVKARNSSQYGTPMEAITYFKMKSLIRTANVYKSARRNLPDLMRIDAVSITFSGQEPVIELIKNISQL